MSVVLMGFKKKIKKIKSGNWYLEMWFIVFNLLNKINKLKK